MTLAHQATQVCYCFSGVIPSYQLGVRTLLAPFVLLRDGSRLNFVVRGVPFALGMLTPRYQTRP